MQYSKQDIFNTLKEIIVQNHPEFTKEQITRDTSLIWKLRFDLYDIREMIILMEQHFKLLNNNIDYLKQFTTVGEFCDNFYNILKEQSPDLIAAEPVSKFPFNGLGFMKRFIIIPNKTK